MTLSVSKGSDWRYCAREVGRGAENYYSAAVASGEPPGVWRGAAAERVGLVGKANDLQLEALYGHFVDPRDPGFEHREQWGEAQRLGRAPATYKSHEQIFAELIAKELDPANVEEERAEELWHQAGTQVRESRAFFDLTYSPSKSVTVLYTAFMSESAAAKQRGDDAESALWESRAKVVEDAVWEASGEMIRRMEREAGYSRAGYHGGKLKSGETTGRWVRGNGFIVASFLQHTSRPVDGREAPQLHVHNLVANRIECEDGKWRTLDGKALYQERAASGALADRVVQARLQRELGVEFAYDPSSKSHEIKGIDRNVRDVFSARRQAITSLLPEYVAAFERRCGREPNALELSELAQRATLKSRQAKLSKDQATTLEEKVEQWTTQAREGVGADLSDIAHNTIGRRDPNAVRTFDVDQVIAQAITSVQETKTVWTRSDLTMHLHRHLPSELASLDTDYQDRILQQLTERALTPDPNRVGSPEEIVCLAAPEFIETPKEFQLPNGESAFRRHGSEVYATRRILAAETQIEDAVRDRDPITRVSPDVALQAVENVNEQLRINDPARAAKLSEDQAGVLAGVLSSGAKVEVIVGPAGTGKSFVMSSLADQWEHHTGGRVVGLATSQNAARVLADEGLARTENITMWLEYQRAIEKSKAAPGKLAKWRLRQGDMVIVDEASMVDTGALAEIQRRANDAGAKVVLVGDHQQLGAVGAGGSFLLAQQSADRVYELQEVRRFKNDWEREASLRFRAGDTDVAREYDAHGRLVDCATLDEAHRRAADLYVADTLAGRQSYLITDNNEAANELSMRVRDQLVQRGLVEEQGVAIGQGETQAVAGVGDVVQARRNSRRIGNHVGERLVNRGRYTVVETHESGDLTVQAIAADGTLGEPINVPADYAQQHMSLGYAVTQHGVQGATGDTGYGIVTPSTSASAAYVALTRGRDLNLAFVVDDGDAKDLDTARAARDADEPARSAAAILAAVIERDGVDRSATQVLRDNLEDAGSMRVIGHRYYESRRYLAEHRYLDMVSDLLPGDAAERFSEDPARASLFRLLDAVEAAGRDPQEVVADAVNKRELGTAESVAQVIHWRITTDSDIDFENVDVNTSEREPVGDTYTARIPDGDTAVHSYAQEWARMADQRVQQLGEIATERPPAWAVEHLGAVPEDPIERAEWIHKAGTVEAYREAYGIADDPAIIGRAPSPNAPERREEWHAAWRALGRPEPLADERQKTDAQLQNAIKTYEAEQEWAPPAVASELRETSLAAVEARAAVSRLSAEAAQLDESDERFEQLQTQISEADEHATELEERRDRLERVHQVRGQWHLATTEERAAATAARQELARREAEAVQAIAENEQTTPSLKERVSGWWQDRRADKSADVETDKSAETERGAEKTEEHAAEETAEREPAQATADAEEPQRDQDQDKNVSPAVKSLRATIPERGTEATDDRAEAKQVEAPAKAEADVETDKSADAEHAAEETAEREPAQATADAEEPQRDQDQDKNVSPAVRAVRAAFPEPVADAVQKHTDKAPVDLDEATEKAEAAAPRLKERIAAAKARKAAGQRERDDETYRKREAAEAARRAAERDQDRGFSR